MVIGRAGHAAADDVEEAKDADGDDYECTHSRRVAR